MNKMKESAFPVNVDYIAKDGTKCVVYAAGLTKREYIAIEFMKCLVSDYQTRIEHKINCALEHADALLLALQEKDEQ